MSSTYILFGSPIINQIACGQAHLLSHATLEASHYNVLPKYIDKEINRLNTAKEQVVADINQSLIENKQSLPEELFSIIEVQKLIMHDSKIFNIAKQKILDNNCNAEYAVVIAMEQIVSAFDNIEDSYLKERKFDIKQIAERIIIKLHKSEYKPRIDKKLKSKSRSGNSPMIIIAHDIAPAELLSLQNTYPNITGFITESGGSNSHTSIIARSQEITAIIGVAHSHKLICEDQWVIIDGNLGIIIVNPDENTLAEYRRILARNNIQKENLQRLINIPTKTLDNVLINLQANIERPEDINSALKVGTKKIGLYRTEYMFLGEKNLPSEELQFKNYKRILTSTKEVCIRTLDLGADKMPSEFAFSGAKVNTNLGLRAIRLCLAYPTIFKTQLRALLRASVYGNLKIILPMISNVQELIRFHQLWKSIKNELTHANIGFSYKIPIGIMVEVPATIFILPQIKKYIDFVSLGTNDLFQFALAVDRNDSEVSHLYDQQHIGVFSLINYMIGFSKKYQIPLTVCGELGGSPRFTKFLLALGLRRFSMNPSQILAFKQQVLNSSIQKLSKKISGWKTKTPEQFENILNSLNQN